MTKLYCALLFLLIPFLALSQIDIQALLSKQNLVYESISHNGDKIEYVITPPLESQKGVIIYCTGSLPVPLFIKVDSILYSSIPFSIHNFHEDYQFICVSKPGVAIIESQSQLNKQNMAVDKEGNLRPYFSHRNHLDYLVASTKAVIDHLQLQKTDQQIIVMGHSQGARIAAKLATIAPNITHLVYLSGNPLGRFDQMIREKREANLLGQISDEQAQEEIGALYQKWEAINADKESLDTKNGDSNKTWASFSEYTVDDLLSLDIPIRVAYGTRDIVSRYCDLLPIHFIQNEKTNLSMKAYPGYDHSFFKVTKEGMVDYDDFIFEQVIKESIDWLKNEK